MADSKGKGNMPPMKKTVAHQMDPGKLPPMRKTVSKQKTIKRRG